MTDHMSSTTCL